MNATLAALSPAQQLNSFPLIIVADDAEFTARTLNNLLWVTFTRSNPAADTHGIGAFTEQKHWGCRGSLVIDARIKPRHAPPLEADPTISASIVWPRPADRCTESCSWNVVNGILGRIAKWFARPSNGKNLNRPLCPRGGAGTSFRLSMFP